MFLPANRCKRTSLCFPNKFVDVTSSKTWMTVYDAVQVMLLLQLCSRIHLLFMCVRILSLVSNSLVIPSQPSCHMCRIHAGPPYEDCAFRIINKEWEYSHKKGFKCTFERGILHLYFNFKRQRYRR